MNRQLGLSKNLENENSKYTAWGMVIIFLIVLILNILNQYGGTIALIKLLYIPVIISVYVFGIKGGVTTSIFAGVSVRPFIILNSLHTTQTSLSWITQTLMFLIVAVIFGVIFKYYLNIKGFLKMRSYQNIQNGLDSNIFRLNQKNIINVIKYRKISFMTFEYKNLDINYVTGKKTCEIIIVNKRDCLDNFNEIHERIAS